MNTTIEPAADAPQSDSKINGSKVPRPPATAEQQKQVIDLHVQRKTKREIEVATRLSSSQVDLILQKFKIANGGSVPVNREPINGTTNPVPSSPVSADSDQTAATDEITYQPASPIPVTPELKQKAFDMFKAGNTKGDVCRSLKLSLSQVRNIKQTYNRQNPKHPWENPEDWVAAQDDVLAQDKVEAKAGVAPVWFLIQALYTGGSRLDGILPFCGDEAERVTPTLTRREWFHAVSKLVMAKGSLRDAIEKQWGEIIKVVPTEKGTAEFLQAPPYGAFLLHRLNLRFVSAENSFYRYFPEGVGNEKEGTWEYLTVTEVQREIMEWVVKKELNRVRLDLSEIGEAMTYMRPLGLFAQHNFSTNPLHVKNGMLFFEEGELVPVNPAYFSRAKLPVTFRASDGAKPSRFIRFLNEAGLLDEDKDILQLWCGFVLLGDNSVNKIMLFTGDAGSGKSTLIELFERMLGHDSIATLNIERLNDRFELGSFFERRLLVAKDVSADALNSQAAYMLKALSGDSLIKAEIKHQNRRVSLRGPFNITITSNSNLFIKLEGDADAWQRRLIILKFRKKPGLVVENKLAEKMFKDEGSAILNWMIKGAIRAREILDQKDKFPKTAEQQKRVNELLRLSDSVKAFVSEEMQSDTKGKITTSALYEAYENYCARNRVLPSPKGAFEREIVLRIQEAWGGEKCTLTDPKTGNPCRGYHGVTFKPKGSPSTPPVTPVPATPSPTPASAPTDPTTKPADVTQPTTPPANSTQAKTPSADTTPATQSPPIQAGTSPSETTPSDEVQF